MWFQLICNESTLSCQVHFWIQFLVSVLERPHYLCSIVQYLSAITKNADSSWLAISLQTTLLYFRAYNPQVIQFFAWKIDPLQGIQGCVQVIHNFLHDSLTVAILRSAYAIYVRMHQLDKYYYCIFAHIVRTAPNCTVLSPLHSLYTAESESGLRRTIQLIFY